MGQWASQSVTDAHAPVSVLAPGLTIVVCALDEEKKITQTLDELFLITATLPYAHEIILVNDGSSDRTGAIMEDMARGRAEVRVVHHPKACGLGSIFQEFLREARFQHLTLVAGDRPNTVEGLERLFATVGSADLIVGFRSGRKRSPGRAAISYAYQATMSLLFGFGYVRDWTGMFVWPVELVRKLGPVAADNTYSVRIIEQLLKQSISIRHVAVAQTPDDDSKSKVAGYKTIAHVANLVWNLKIRGRR